MQRRARYGPREGLRLGLLRRAMDKVRLGLGGLHQRQRRVGLDAQRHGQRHWLRLHLDVGGQQMGGGLHHHALLHGLGQGQRYAKRRRRLRLVHHSLQKVRLGCHGRHSGGLVDDDGAAARGNRIEVSPDTPSSEKTCHR